MHDDRIASDKLIYKRAALLTHFWLFSLPSLARTRAACEFPGNCVVEISVATLGKHNTRHGRIPVVIDRSMPADSCNVAREREGADPQYPCILKELYNRGGLPQRENG